MPVECAACRARNAHRGDSGSHSSPAACTRAGSAAAPSIQRQVPGTYVNPKSAAYAMNWPPVIISVLAVTMPARHLRGLASCSARAQPSTASDERNPLSALRVLFMAHNKPTQAPATANTRQAAAGMACQTRARELASN